MPEVAYRAGSVRGAGGLRLAVLHAGCVEVVRCGGKVILVVSKNQQAYNACKVQSNNILICRRLTS